MTLRPAELAGRWYPAGAEACAKFLQAVPLDASAAGRLPPKAAGAIVPHAGWVYSGAVAFEALRGLHAHLPDADLVLVFGGHLGKNDEPRLLVEGGWETPFGPLELATGLAQDLAMGISCDLETPAAFYDDNAVEVELPMIKYLWPGAKVLALGVPPVGSAGAMGREAVELAKRRGFRRIAVVGSTDLTHYGPNYDFMSHGRGFSGHRWVTTENDPEMVKAIEAMDAQAVLWAAERKHNACCPGAIAASISAARALGAERGVATRYTTSWDVRADGKEPTSFVGYAGVLLGS